MSSRHEDTAVQVRLRGQYSASYSLINATLLILPPISVQSATVVGSCSPALKVVPAV